MSQRDAEIGTLVLGWRTCLVRNACTFSTTIILGLSSRATLDITVTRRFRASFIPASGSPSLPRWLRAELIPWHGGQAASSVNGVPLEMSRYSSTTIGQVLRRSPATPTAFG